MPLIGFKNFPHSSGPTAAFTIAKHQGFLLSWNGMYPDCGCVWKHSASTVPSNYESQL